MVQRAQLLDPPLEDLVQLYDRQGPIPISEETYLRIALDDPHIKWELHDGLLVEKPGMSFTHMDVLSTLNYQLVQHLEFQKYRVLINDGRLRRPSRNYLIPDVSVVSSETVRRLRREQPKGLGVFDEPLFFVAEVWSPSTGGYDVNTKIPVYKRRGDLEIWRIQPFERIVTVWVWQSDDQYSETSYHGGVVSLSALPGVTIDLDALFDVE